MSLGHAPDVPASGDPVDAIGAGAASLASGPDGAGAAGAAAPRSFAPLEGAESPALPAEQPAAPNATRRKMPERVTESLLVAPSSPSGPERDRSNFRCKVGLLDPFGRGPSR